MAAPPQSAAIYYSSVDYDPYKRMMGRQVASEAFLKAAALYDPSSELLVYGGRAEEVKTFQQVQERMGAPKSRTYRFIRMGDIGGAGARRLSLSSRSGAAGRSVAAPARATRAPIRFAASRTRCRRPARSARSASTSSRPTRNGTR